MADSRPINWTNAVTLGSVAVLVGTELVGAGFAAGWAIGGLFQLGDLLTHGLEALLVLIALTGCPISCAPRWRMSRCGGSARAPPCSAGSRQLFGFVTRDASTMAFHSALIVSQFLGGALA